MSTMQNFTKVAGIAAVTIGISACDHSPPQSETDRYMEPLLVENAENPQSLVNTHHILENEDGKQLGVIFIKAVQDKGEALCADYSAYTFSTATDATATQSVTREMCISNYLLEKLGVAPD